MKKPLEDTAELARRFERDGVMKVEDVSDLPAFARTLWDRAKLKSELAPDLVLARKMRVRNISAGRIGGKVRGLPAEKVDALQHTALKYRRGNPDASARAMAQHLANRLRLPFGTVRDRLRKLKIK